VESFAVNTGPTKPHAFGTIEPVQQITKNPDCALAQSKQQTVGNRHLHPVRRPQSSFLEHQSS
jgi:hypothetical protein